MRPLLETARLDARTKIQNILSCGSTPCWVTVDERWASSGGQGKLVVEVGNSANLASKEA